MKSEDDFEDEDFGIFQNQDKVAENLKESAEDIGLNIDEGTIKKLAEGLPQEVLVAKNNCTWCHGRGTVDYVANKAGDKHNQPEAVKDGDWKVDNMTKALCKCVKARLV